MLAIGLENVLQYQQRSLTPIAFRCALRRANMSMYRHGAGAGVPAGVASNTSYLPTSRNLAGAFNRRKRTYEIFRNSSLLFLVALHQVDQRGEG